MMMNRMIVVIMITMMTVITTPPTTTVERTLPTASNLTQRMAPMMTMDPQEWMMPKWQKMAKPQEWTPKSELQKKAEPQEWMPAEPGVDAEDSGTPGVDAEDGGTTGVDAEENAEEAENTGANQAALERNMEDKYGPRNKRYNMRQQRECDYSHLFANTDADANPDADEPLTTPQMSMKKGLMIFREHGVEAMKKEMLQLHERKVMEPRHAAKLSPTQKR
jgi:hypothetical protein